MKKCIFCDWSGSTIFENDHFYAIYDKYPVNPGHLLIVSKRHITDIFSLNQTEFHHLQDIVNEAKRILDRKFQSDGYNIGANCGEAAGQTAFHFHLHIIPRYKNDVANPQGGIRNLKTPVRAYHSVRT